MYQIPLNKRWFYCNLLIMTLLLGTFAWMACNFAVMATCLNGLCMSPFMLQLWVSWSESNGMNSKIVTLSLHYIKLYSRFWHCCQVSYFFIPIFFTKNNDFASSKCYTSSQRHNAYNCAFMHLHFISLHDSIMCNFSVLKKFVTCR